MTVRCKLRCTAKTLEPRHNPDGSTGQAARLHFTAIYEPDADKRRATENKIFGDATPYAVFDTYIANEAAHERFEQGKDYYVDFTPVPE